MISDETTKAAKMELEPVEGDSRLRTFPNVRTRQNRFWLDIRFWVAKFLKTEPCVEPPFTCACTGTSCAGFSLSAKKFWETATVGFFAEACRSEELVTSVISSKKCQKEAPKQRL